VQPTSITVRRFSAFEDLELGFSRGLNVFIGENATGKSHMMKLLYVLLAVAQRNRSATPSEAQRRWEEKLHDKLAGVFRPDGDRIGRLVHRGVGRQEAKVTLHCGTDQAVGFSLSSLDRLRVTAMTATKVPRSIFLPTREALAMYEGFISAYENRELSFDETYYDLCKALSGTPLRGPRMKKARDLIEPLEEILGGRVVLKGGRFYVHSKVGEGVIEAHLLAEGYRKIASLAHLIANGSLLRNSVLFWDEPEANLNPRLVTKVVDVLRSLAAGGVQVFVSTHDYLVSQEFALAAEYRTKPTVPTRFFAFGRQSLSAPVQVEAADRLHDLDDNAILQEFAEHYDREQELFYGRPTAQGEGRE